MVQAERRELFTNRSLLQLLLPLFIEQRLAIAIGAADTVMVSSLGEAAVSAVSLAGHLGLSARFTDDFTIISGMRRICKRMV